MDSAKLMEESAGIGAAVKGSISSRVKRYLRKANDISKRTMNSRKAQEDIAMDLSKGQEHPWLYIRPRQKLQEIEKQVTEVSCESWF